MFFFCANSLKELSTSKSMFAASTNKENEISELTLFRIGSFVKPIIKIEKISNLFTNKLDDSKFRVLLLNDSHSKSFGVVKEETLSRIISNYYSETTLKSLEENHVIMILEYELIRRSNQMLRDDEISFFMNSNKADNLNSDLPLISLESFIIIGKDTTCSTRGSLSSSSTCQDEEEEEEDDDDDEEIDEEKALAMLSASASTSSQHQHQKHHPPPHHHHESSEQSSSILSIYSLSPSLSNQIWTIKSCLSKISPVKEFPYKKGDFGRVMRMQFYDRTGYIEVVFFNEFIDRYKGFLEIGKFYLIRNSEIKYSNKTYRAWPEDLYSNFDLIVTKTTEFQLTDSETILKSEIAAPSSYRSEQQQKTHTLNSQHLAKSQTRPISLKHASTTKEQQSDTFISLDQLILKKNRSLVDVIGVVCEIGELTTVKRGGGKKPLYIRRINIVDETADPISVAFWGEQASSLKAQIGQIYMFKGVELTSYGGISLSILRTTGFLNITGYYNVSGVEKLAMWWRRVKTQYSTSLKDDADNGEKELGNGKGLKRERGQDDNEREVDNDHDHDNDDSCEPKENNKKLFKRG